MAANFDPKDVLEIQIDADPKKAILAMTKWQRDLSSHMKKAQEATGKVDKGFGKLMKNIGMARSKAAGMKQLTAQFKKADEALKDDKRTGSLKVLLQKARARDASGKRTTAAGSDARKQLLAQIQAIKKAEGITSLRSVRRDAKAQSKELESGAQFDWEEAGETFAEPIHDFLSKDAPTMIKRLAKIAMGANSLAKGTKAFGGRLSERGSDMMRKGGVVGKSVGIAAKTGGELTKMFGGLASVMTSLGPILSTVSSFMMSFIKIMIDAESIAKDFNKQLLSTTSTAGYLSSSYGDVGKATKALSDDLDMARNAAKDESNMWKMGLTSEAAASFQAAITSEGVALERLGKATAGATKSTEQHIKTLHMGVAFSRTFGVSLSEIASMQGQMMSDIGMSNQGVVAGFQQIVDGAKEAGIESNKFFQIVRGFSSDLSLFALRMDDVTRLLGIMGKNMDPRKVAQFLQKMSGQFSGGATSNLKFGALAGAEREKLLTADVARKFAALDKTLKSTLGDKVSQEQIDELHGKIRANDTAGIAKWESQFRDDKGKELINGALASSITQLARMNMLVSKGDLVSQTTALQYGDPTTQQRAKDAAIRTATGGVGIKDLSGNTSLVGESLGVSEEDIKGAMELDAGSRRGIEQMLKELEAGRASEVAQRLLDHFKLNSGDAKTTADALRAKLLGDEGTSLYQDYAGTSEDKALTEAEQTKKFQEQAAGLQTSMLDQLSALYDVLMNKIYGVMHSIWEGVMDIFNWLKWGSGKAADFSKAEIEASRSGNLKLQKAIERAKGMDPEKGLTQAKNEAIENVTGDALKALNNAHAEYETIGEKLKNENDPQARTRLDNRRSELKAAHDAWSQYSQGKSEKDVQTLLYAKAKEDNGVANVMRLLGQWLELGKSSPNEEKTEPTPEQSDVALLGGNIKSTQVAANEAKKAQDMAMAADKAILAQASQAPDSFFEDQSMLAANSAPRGYPGSELASAGVEQKPPVVILPELVITMKGDAKRLISATAQNVVSAHAKNRRKA